MISETVNEEIYEGLASCLLVMISDALEKLNDEQLDLGKVMGGDFWNNERIIHIHKLCQCFKLIYELSQKLNLTPDDTIGLIESDVQLLENWFQSEARQRGYVKADKDNVGH